MPLVAAYHTHYNDRVRYYTSPAGMITDGFAVTDAAYLAVSAGFAQNPAPAKIGVGRRALGTNSNYHLTVTSSVQGDVVALQVGSPGNLQTVSYTIPASSSQIAVATAVSALITGHGVIASSGGSAVITLIPSTNPGLVDVKNWTSNLTFQDVSTDPGIATDLAAIRAADDTWYGLGLDSNSPAEIAAAAAWTESNKKFLGVNASDAICATTSTSDIMSTLTTSAYTRTGCWFSGSQVMSYSGFAIVCLALPKIPGSYTLAYKAPAGIPADGLATLNETQLQNVLGKNGNVLMPIAGLNTTFPGISPSKEFLDTVVFVDWLTAKIQVDEFALLHSVDKVPFTDFGVDMLRSVALADLNAAASPPINGLVPGTIFFNAPPVASVSTTDRGNRNLPACTFGGRLQGAIHTLNFVGTLTV